MSRLPFILLTLACALALALGAAPPAQAGKSGLPKGCPEFKGKPTGYMIGSSTMGSVLGPMLKGMLKRRWKVESRHWGKASSGLARPDFHDWPRKAGGLMARYKPDFVIVSLGTNDNQALRIGKKWLRPKRRERWEKLYAERVRSMLKTLSGANQARPIIWMGPTAFEGRTARIMGPRINAIMKREVEAFEGNATFIDVYRPTRKPNGKMETTFQAPDRKQPEGLRGHDGIHLTARAVKYLMAEPALKPLAPCFKGHVAAWEAAEKVRDEERRKKAAQRKVEREQLKAERKAKRIQAYKEKLEKKRLAKEARLEARRLRMAKKKGEAPALEGAKQKAGSPEQAKGASERVKPDQKIREAPTTAISDDTKETPERAAPAKKNAKTDQPRKATKAKAKPPAKPAAKKATDAPVDQGVSPQTGAEE